MLWLINNTVSCLPTPGVHIYMYAEGDRPAYLPPPRAASKIYGMRGRIVARLSMPSMQTDPWQWTMISFLIVYTQYTHACVQKKTIHKWCN